MKYYVEAAGRSYEVEVDAGEVRVAGRPVAVDIGRAGASGLVHVLLDGRSHAFRLRRVEGRGEWEVEIGGRPYRLTALDQRRHAIRRIAGSATGSRGPIEVKAPMPGLVVAVQVSEGDPVSRGQALVVIEAMKMENELKADADGRVGRVRASAGQPVEKGEALLVIEVPEDGG